MALESVNHVQSESHRHDRDAGANPWPIALAFGMTLLFAGMVTSEAVSVLGAIVAIAGAVGWFRDVLPHEAHETVQVMPETGGRHDGGAKWLEWRSQMNCSGLICRSRSIRFRRNQGRSGRKRGDGVVAMLTV
jgi:hypothetical protein